MIDHNMDGLILIAPRLPRDVIRRFATTNPIVIIGHHFSDETTFDTVNADDARGASSRSRRWSLVATPTSAC